MEKNIIMKYDLEKIKHLYPFKSNFLTIGDLNYHYINEGKGEPLLMVHGNPTWSFYFRNLVSKLSDKYQTIVPDHIGCGLSDKPEKNRYDYKLQSRVENLERLVNQLNPEKKITLILHDWGGMIGLAFALRNMDKVGRIILTNTSGFFPPGRTIPFRLFLMRYLTPFAKPATLGLNLFSAAALFMATKKGLACDVKKGLTLPYNSWKNRIATYEFVQDIPLAKQDRSYDLVKQVDDNLHRLKKLPILILWGEHDFIFTMEYFNEWKKRFPEAKAVSFPESGHYLFEDEPEKTLALIEEFLSNNPL
jgi:haloalkane dehalogenase